MSVKLTKNRSEVALNMIVFHARAKHIAEPTDNRRIKKKKNYYYFLFFERSTSSLVCLYTTVLLYINAFFSLLKNFKFRKKFLLNNNGKLYAWWKF